MFPERSCPPDWRKPARSWGPEYDHLALHVRVGGSDFLADVGYGDSFRAPLALPAGAASDVSGHYRLLPADGELQLEHASVPGHWRPLYRVSLRPRTLAEFGPMFHWHQTSPESPFGRRPPVPGPSLGAVVDATVTERYPVETRGAHTTRQRYQDPVGVAPEARSRFGVLGPRAARQLTRAVPASVGDVERDAPARARIPSRGSPPRGLRTSAGAMAPPPNRTAIASSARLSASERRGLAEESELCLATRRRAPAPRRR
jgi:hypothetical protein